MVATPSPATPTPGLSRSRVTLVPGRHTERATPVWTGGAAELLARVHEGAGHGRAVGHTPAWNPVQVLGAPGTGKSALLEDIAVAAIAGGADPESVMVLAQSRRGATDLRERITRGLFERGRVGLGPQTSREPLVRTLHSYAFAVLRLQAAQYGNPPPRLITGSEQDQVFRELLRGDIEDEADYWPEHVLPALGLNGFAVELRNLLLRSVELGLGPEDLVKLGRKRGRPEWVAAGRFATTYEQVMLLRGSVGMEAPQATAPALDAAELIGAALMAFATDPELIVAERARIRYLLVDDAQHLDPQAADLVKLLGSGTVLTVVAGDGDQSIYQFRGADPVFLTDLAAKGSPQRVVLDTNHRSDPAITEAVNRIAAKLPGASPQRKAYASALPPSERSAEPPVAVRVFATQAQEAAAIADMLRRAHISDGVPWSAMAVVVRSVPSLLAPMRRALASAGVPLTMAASELPLGRQNSSSALLLVLKAAARTISMDEAVDLLTGAVGAVDPLELRQIRRGLRRFDAETGGEHDSSELIRNYLVGADHDWRERAGNALSRMEAAALDRAREVVEAARRMMARGRGVEEVLWEAWRATGLEQRWVNSALRGGAMGAQADRDLDAVVALFDAAANYVDRLPAARVTGFIEYITDQEIPVDPWSKALATPEAVTITSAHAAAGREWEVVAVAGVQEGQWPVLRGRGSLLGVEDIAEAIDQTNTGAPTVTVSRLAPIIADERRLFLVACSRARARLLVTAVESTTGGTELTPSRFLAGITDDGVEEGALPPVWTSKRPVLALPALVARLRAVVTAEREPQERKERAARQLAVLAAARVPGAHPDDWHGIGTVSTDTPLWLPEKGPIRLSPSTIELLSTCPLRWLLERHGGTDGDNVNAIKGTLVHTLVQAVAGQIPEDQVRLALMRAWDRVDLGSAWFARHELARTEAMLDNFREWLATTRTELTVAGVETRVDGILEPPGGIGPQVRLTGRIDRLEHDADGRPVVIDVKTTNNVVSQTAAEEHAQLATYQVAAAAGAIENEPAEQPGGARLVFVAQAHKKTGASERRQQPLDEERLNQWTEVIHTAAQATIGPVFEARVNDGCGHCPIRPSCPAHDSGRQVTSP